MSIQSVDRALEILEIIAKGPITVTEIAEELGVHKSTVSRLVSSLSVHQLLERPNDRGQIILGLGITRLAGAALRHSDLVKLATPICDNLAQELGETANLAVLDHDRAINIVESLAPHNVGLNSWIGQSSPAHATSSGKALLCELSEDNLRRIFPEQLPAYTPNTITSRDQLINGLKTIQQQGWAHADNELEEGLFAIAAPVRNFTSKIIASLCISGPKYRQHQDLIFYIQPLQNAATQLSEKLGFQPA